MRRMLVVAALVALVACGKGRKKDHEGQLVRFYGSGGEAFALGGKLEVAGVLGKDMSVDIPLDKAPKAGAEVFVVFDSPCGGKRIPIKLPSAKRGGATGEPSDESSFDFFYGFDVPKLGVMRQWHVVYDTALTAKVELGTMKGDVTAGLPHGDLAPPKLPSPRPADGSMMLDLDCLKELTVNGTKVAIPPRTHQLGAGDYHTLFVTDRPDQCFEDRTVAYGDAPGGGHATELKGQRVYWLDGDAPYAAYFEPIASSRTVSRGANVAYTNALNVCGANK